MLSILFATVVFSFSQNLAYAAVSFGTAGAVAAGSTSLTVPYPASIVAGDLLVLTVGNKYPTNGPATPAGWTLVTNGQGSGGVGSAGTDSGTVYATVFVKQAVGGESGNLTVTLAGANSSMGRMFRYTKASVTIWDYAATNGSDATAGTAWSVTGAANPGIVSGDMLVVASAINGNVVTSWASESVSAAGATFTTHTERQDSNSTTGDDMTLVVSDHTVTAGTASAAPVFTMTGTGTPTTNSPTGASVMLRIREVPIPPTITTNAASALTSTGATLNGTVSSNGSSTTVTFDYGLTAAYGSSATATQSPLAAAASGSAVSVAVTGLTCSTSYHFRVNAVNSVGTSNGNDLTFATSACPAPIVTSINTSSASPTKINTAVTWTVVFDTAVTGVDLTDFSLVQADGVTGASLSSVSGSGTTYTVTANTGTGTIGTLTLKLIDNDTIINAYSVPLGGVGAGNGNFTGQSYTVCSPPSNIPAGVSCQCDTFGRAALNPSTIFGANWIVSTSDATGILPSIVNSGYLRLTNNTGNNAKAVTVPGIFPAAGNYISVEFRQYAYNGTGADGIAVTLSDYAVPAVPGAYGGSLGYAQETGIHDGFAGGWLGVGLDEYGNYQNPTEGRLGGPGFIVQSVGARGSGSVQSGYRWLGGTATLATKIDNKASTTASLGYYYQVIVDATLDPASTAIAVNRDTGSGYASLISIPNVYTAATAQGFTQAAVPGNWQISFTGSTGGSTNIHEIGGLRICASTMVPTSGGTAGGFSAIDEAYGTPPLAVQNYLSGRIYTKLVGTAFKLDVAVLSSGQLVTTYAASSSKTVTVNLVDNSDSLTDATKDCTLSCTSTCTSKTAVTGGTQTLTFASGSPDKGQKQSPNFTINSAYQKLVAIISDGTTTACSIDSFAVRPLSIASVTSSNATNTTTTGTPIFKAGSDKFSLTATTTGVVGSPSGYIGVIKINNAVVQAASPATVPGAVTGTTFPTATSATPSSAATGTTFTYSEVGGFKLPGFDPASDTTTRRSVYDGVATADECTTTAQCDTLKAATWTGVDSISSKGDCVADSYSNTKNASGKYGCNFGLLPNTAVFGRFVPDHFDTVVTQVASVPMACPDSTCPTTFNGIVYSGQPFSLTVTAKNGLATPNTTVNYNATTGLSKVTTLSAWDALGSTTTQNPGSGSLTNNTILAARFIAGASPLLGTVGVTSGSATVTGTGTLFLTQLAAGDVINISGVNYVVSGITSNTSLTLTASYIAATAAGIAADVMPTYTFAVVPTSRTNIYIRAIDTDGVTSQRATSVEGGVQVVSGRIKISNAYGSEQLPLPLTATVQYWGGTSTGYVNSTTDNVSTVTVAKISRSNCLGYLQTSGACNALGGVSSVASVPATPPPYGVFSILLAAPGAGKTGSEDLIVNTGGWPAWLLSTTGHATFGVYKGSSYFIYQRENY